MLQELTIKDFAIIEEVSISFQSKMTVLTGETGSGKSIIIDALSLLAGGRASSEFIRKGANKAFLQAQFDLKENDPVFNCLDKIGIDHQDSVLILRRDLYRSGRNVCRINGILVNLTTLRQIGSRLIDIQGQNEHQSLMHAETHLHLLDSYDDSLQQDIVQYHKLYTDYSKLKKQLLQRQTNEKEWAQRLDMLKFQLQEIEGANLVPHEEEKLMQEKDQLDNYQAIHEALENSYQVLEGNEDLTGQLGTIMDELNKVASFSDLLKDIAEKISDAFYNLQDVAREVSRQLDSMEWDEGRLDQIEQRLELIHQLKRKYGDSVGQIIDYGLKIKKELSEMQDVNKDATQEESALEKVYKAALKSAKKLSTKRHQVALKLEEEMHIQLSDLRMGKAVFKVSFKENQNLTRNGIDSIEFYIQTNPGESMSPLVKIASGGELSRVMLALKTMFAHNEGVTTIIFDEVDTGVSGKVAQAMAEKISQIAQYTQVLCISHLPQVAAIADHHYLITKEVVKGRTITHISKLDAEENVQEIARMLSGSKITKLTFEHAAELVKIATQIKKELKNKRLN